MNFLRRNRNTGDRATTTSTASTYNNGPTYNTNAGTYGTSSHPHTGTLGTNGLSNDPTYNSNSSTLGTGTGTGTGIGKHNYNNRTDDLEYGDEKGHRRNKPAFDVNSGNFNRRPSFGQWLKFTILDIITMACMGAVGLGVYNADPAPSRSFPVTFQDGNTVYPQFAYPMRREIVPIWLAALLASIIPIFIFLVMQIRIRSFWDVNNAIIGLLYSLITAAVFQVFIKWLIGGLRPHFYEVCAPDVNLVTAGGNGFRNLMFDRSICTGDRDQINDSLESMPSGHSTAAFAGFIFLYLYLNAKLKVFANYHPAMWKLIVVYAPVLGACLIAGSLTIDEFHNWYDCLAGAVIGTIMAFSAYRMVYASVWDFRFNHIPLTRHTPFSYGAGEAGAGGFESSVFTRRAGWGYEEAFGGAPFDAAHHLRGMQAGFNNAVHQHDHSRHKSHGSGGGLLGNLTHRNHNNNDATVNGNTHGHNRNHNHGVGATGVVGAAAAGAAAEHHHDRHSRLDNHQAGLGHSTTGIGHHNTTGGIGHHNTTGIGGTHNTTGIGHNVTGLGHHNTNTDATLGHNHTTLGHNRNVSGEYPTTTPITSHNNHHHNTLNTHTPASLATPVNNQIHHHNPLSTHTHTPGALGSTNAPINDNNYNSNVSNYTNTHNRNTSSGGGLLSRLTHGNHNHNHDTVTTTTTTNPTTSNMMHDSSHHHTGLGRRSGDYDGTGTGLGRRSGDHDGTGAGLGRRSGDYDGTGILPSGDRHGVYDSSMDERNRYRVHSRSLERKAVPRTGAGNMM